MVTENLQPNYVTAYYQVNKCWHNKKKFYKKINQIRGSKSFFFLAQQHLAEFSE